MPSRIVRTISLRSMFPCPFPCPLFAAFDEDFDAPVLGAPLRRRVAGDRRVGALTFDVDPVRISKAQLEQGSDRLGAFDREFEIRWEPHGSDGRIVGMS